MKKLVPTIITGLITLSGVTEASETLPPLALDLSQTTVSGLSSGGYMATQFHLANSNWINGAALIGTGPYYCAQGDIGIALGQCVSKLNSPIDTSDLLAQAKEYAKAGLLPALDNLADDRVWILHGTQDSTVNRGAADALVAQYQHWVTNGTVTYIDDKPFAHHFPTEDQGSSCSVSESPYLGACGYDAAGELLQALLGELNPKATGLPENLHRFDQHVLGGEPAEGLAESGYVYIPTACAAEDCRLHISFHGCNQNMQAVGDTYASSTGLNAWAETNRIVVLYPQTKTSMIMPLNPQGCWDWWGYSGNNYANSEAAQVVAITNMIEQLNSRSQQSGN